MAFENTVQLWQKRGATRFLYSGQPDAESSSPGRWRLFRTYKLDNALDYVASISFIANGDLLVGYQASGIR